MPRKKKENVENNNIGVGEVNTAPVIEQSDHDTSIQKEKIRSMVSNIYDIQKMRIQCGNRLVASFMGLSEASRNRTAESVKAKKEAEEKEGKDDDKRIKQIMSEYKRITDVIAADTKKKRISNSDIRKAINELNKSSEKLEFIGEVYDYQMADTYEQLLNIENKAVSALSDEVKKHPMWHEFFEGVRGCGPMMAAICISYFDIYKARHPASFWKYAGLDVVVKEDGTTEGRSRRHTEMQEYVDKDGNIKEKVGITFNPILKTKLIGVLGSSFIKSAKTKDGTMVGYGKIYYDYKNRLNNRVDADKLTTAHKHNMAIRYAVKQFVRDLWIAWRTYEGLEVGEPYYEVAKLGHKPHGFNT